LSYSLKCLDISQLQEGMFWTQQSSLKLPDIRLTTSNEVNKVEEILEMPQGKEKKKSDSTEEFGLVETPSMLLDGRGVSETTDEKLEEEWKIAMKPSNEKVDWKTRKQDLLLEAMCESTMQCCLLVFAILDLFYDMHACYEMKVKLDKAELGENFTAATEDSRFKKDFGFLGGLSLMNSTYPMPKQQNIFLPAQTGLKCSIEDLSVIFFGGHSESLKI